MGGGIFVKLGLERFKIVRDVGFGGLEDVLANVSEEEFVD